MTTTLAKPAIRPARPEFSSGPCAKRPGWTPENLRNAVLGRSHRSKLGKARLKAAIDQTREVLEVPADFLIGIVAGFADRVMVMYSGRIVEENEAALLFREPQHPYTRGLLEAVPRADVTVARLPSIPGAPPTPAARPGGCSFHPRCDRAMAVCSAVEPVETVTPIGARVRCHLHGAV